MFTAKQIIKAEFIKARNAVAAMDDQDVIWEDQSSPYEQSSNIFFRREISRRARRIYAAMPEASENVQEDVEALFDSVEVLDLETLLNEALSAS